MTSEILMNVTPMETRVAEIENGILQEIHIERSAKLGIVGNIYRGKVVRVLPGMQAAFVEIGLGKAAFIHANDFHRRQQTEVLDDAGVSFEPENITQLVHEGQSIIVQVIKDPISTKGARLTTHLTIPSRYLVVMPQTDHIGISQRIEDEAERERLRVLVENGVAEQQLKGKCGFIVRTAADGAGAHEINEDIKFLRRLWDSLQERMKGATVPSVIYEDLTLSLRTIRDLMSPNIEKIRVDSKENYKRMVQFAQEFVPDMLDRIENYRGDTPIFDLYGIEDEIQKGLGKRVPLKSGGYLIIDQTEAMTTVDVNTGGFVGNKNLEDTIFKTNLEATTVIGRQLRLRNLGGIIILDFIDMEDSEHQRQVMRLLEKVLEKDHAKIKITGVSELGLVEMTRKRNRESLEQMLCESCHVCQGTGTVKTAETVCYEIFREIIREARAYNAGTYLVLASQSVVDRLLDEDSASVADLEAFIEKPIKFRVESMYTQEQFDVILQ